MSLRSVLPIAILSAVVLLAGCAAPTEPSSEAPSPQPTHMLGGNTNQIYNQCMLDAGWFSQEVESGGLIFGAPVDQASAFEASDAACMEEAGIDPNVLISPLTEEQLREAHASVSNLRTCLIEAGFVVGEPPSLQSFVDSQGAWTPFDDLHPGDILDAEKSCSQANF